jgi:type III restriction enzyme
MARPQIVIENPILNAPYDEPGRHFRFDDDGITDEVLEGRRASSYFMPIPKAKTKGGQLVFDEWTGDRIEENRLINQIRERVARWRGMGWPGVTSTTRALLEYWTNPERDRKLFFCQIEALETAIFLTEAARKTGDAWIENSLRTYAEDANPGLFRLAHKMATGTGKTVVMAMIIAWHTLNKAANGKDGRFSDAFLIVAPGITIRDRLRVLLPSDPQNYYRERDIVPPGRLGDLGRAKIVITNLHAFQLREKLKAPKLTKLVAGQQPGVFTETPHEMVRRVPREFGTKRNIVVLNDEAHHCYRRRVGPDGGGLDSLSGEDKREAAKRDEEARVWVSGLEAVAAKTGVRAVYDLSATPFYLRGSGWPEGTLFQWVVSDFSLIDAIEAGLVKIPRVPIDDNAAQSDDLPTYRGLWLRIRDDLPKKGRKTDAVDGREPILPGPLEGALHSLFQRRVEDDAFRSSPTITFLERLPDKVAAEIQAVLEAVAAAPPPAFSGGGKWEAMHDAMAGFYEVRVQGGGANHRLFCVLERNADDLGGPSIVCIGGLSKPIRSAADPRDYRQIRQYADEFRQRRTVYR